MTLDETAKRKLELDALYQDELRSRGALVSRFARHDLIAVTTLSSVPVQSTVSQLVTAALIEAYRLGAAEAAASASAAAKAETDGRLAAARRAVERALDEVRRAL